MTSITPSLVNYKLDLRAPIITQINKKVAGNWQLLIGLMLLDSSVLFVGWQIAEIYGDRINYAGSLRHNLLSLWPILVSQLGIFSAAGLYSSREKCCDYFRLFKTLTFFYVLLLLVTLFNQASNFIPWSTFILSWLLSIFFTCIIRLGVNTAIQHLHQKGAVRSSTFLISSLEDREKAIKLLGQENHYNLLGWADVNLLATDTKSLEAVLEQISKLNIDEVFICSWQSIKSKMLLYWRLRNTGITLHILPIELDGVDQNLEIKMLGNLPALKFHQPLVIGSDFFIKRCIDFCCSIAFILLAMPLYILIALSIKLDSSGPVFYKQVRIGLHGKPFKVWKFRTMVVNAEQIQKDLEADNEMKDGVLFKIKNDPRITPLGKFLRRYSLDELPQMFNVLFGEMSLVGPRPLPLRDVEKFSEHHFVRHNVLPGITGLWQVSGRSDIIDFEQVIRLDVSYIESWSLKLDFQILLKTINVIFGKKGAY